MNISNISYDRFTKKELQVRHGIAEKYNRAMKLSSVSFRDFIVKYYPSYLTELNLPVPVLADDASRFVTEESRIEARESTTQTRPQHEEGSRGGQKPFDKKAYQKEYMRKKRAKNK